MDEVTGGGHAHPMSASVAVRPTRRRPWATDVTALACVVGAVVGAVLVQWVDAPSALAGHVYEDLALALAWSVLGALLARRVPEHPFGRLFLVVAASFALAVAASGYTVAAQRYGWPGAAAAGWLGGWVWTVGTFLPITTVLLLFPDGRLPSPRWRPVAVAGVGGLVVVIAGAAGGELIALGPETTVANPLSFPGAGALFLAGGAVLAAAALASAVALLRRLASATGERRRQLAPVAAAGTMALLGAVAAGLLPDWGPVVQLVTLPLLPAAAALAVVRYRLYEIELIVRRSLVFVGLTVVVVGGYALVVQGVAGLLQRQAGLPESLLATGAVALAFQPARAVLQRLVTRWLYGERDDPAVALARAGEQLTGAADPDVAVHASTGYLARALRVPWLALRTSTGTLIESGARPGWVDDSVVEHAALLHLGAVHGELIVARRSPREPLSAADRALLHQLAVPLAAVVANGQLVEELRHSRERIVTAREEERRRLRRDLHDGLGALLAAVAAQADVAALRLARDPATAVDLVDRLRATSGEALDDLRRIVEDLRPAALDELGLTAALTELAAALSVPGGVQVTLHAELPPTLPAAVDVAAYRIASEAVGNAVRHARAERVRIAVDAGDDDLELDITDDGIGFSPGAGHDVGVGLSSMRERTDELGGRFSLTSGTGGTRVLVTLPLGGGRCD